MARDFNNFNDFNRFLKSKPIFSASSEEEIIEESLTVAAVFIEEKVKEKFGHYQTGWEELSTATKEDRVRQGYTPNNPLLRDGALRDSVKMNVKGTSASIGSNNPIMIWQEKGTTRTGWHGAKGIPPRPVFLLTHQEDGKEAVELFVRSYFKLAWGIK